jgi:hypothetical protein
MLIEHVRIEDQSAGFCKKPAEGGTHIMMATPGA